MLPIKENFSIAFVRLHQNMSVIKVITICYYIATFLSFLTDLVLQWEVLLISYPHLLSKAEESSNVHIRVHWKLHVGAACQNILTSSLTAFILKQNGKCC